MLIIFLSSSDDDHIPLAKRAKLSVEITTSTKELNPPPAKSTPPARTAVEKIPQSRVISPGDAPTSSTVRDHVSIQSKPFLLNPLHLN
jgi:hypothetical protein